MGFITVLVLHMGFTLRLIYTWALVLALFHTWLMPYRGAWAQPFFAYESLPLYGILPAIFYKLALSSHLVLLAWPVYKSALTSALFFLWALSWS